MKKKENLTEK